MIDITYVCSFQIGTRPPQAKKYIKCLLDSIRIILRGVTHFEARFALGHGDIQTKEARL
jgi:hypothetical protein